MKVQAWKTPDGKLFEDEITYLKHVKKCEEKNAAKQKLLEMEQRRKDIISALGECKSLSEIENFIYKNWEWFSLNACSLPKKRKSELVQITFTRMSWKNHQSNSHSCPVGGVINWGSDPSKPTGYPGWRGHLSFILTGTSGFGPDYFRGTPINTGGGGGDSGQYSYEVILFAADFPKLEIEL